MTLESPSIAAASDAAPDAARSRSGGGIMLGFANAGDDAGIRALLRTQPMGGAIRLSLEREPDASLAAEIEGDTHHAVVARDLSGAVVGVGSRSVRNVWFNGRAARLGYLGLLRRDPKLMGYFRLLREGFDRLETTRRDDELPFDLTSIVADNRAARRALERGLHGLPRYEPWCEWATLVIPTTRRQPRRDDAVAPAKDDDVASLAALLQLHGRRHQFAPCYVESDLVSPHRSRGLSMGDHLLLREHGVLRASIACWDQRAFKQVVVRGYSPALTRWRPWINRLFNILGRPVLPDPDLPLRHAYLSHAATCDDDPQSLVRLIAQARHAATRRELDYLVFGIAAESPMLQTLRRAFKPREYRSVLYLVSRHSRAAWSVTPDTRPPHVEVATL